jgi:hypothetical protein
VNLKTWQKDVERYVEKRDNDPAVLRDVTLGGGQGGRRGFAVIGKDDARVSTDANGVLVAHESALNRPWFVYLVGVVDEQKVKEIRVAALSMLHGKATWRVGPKDPEALKRYRDAGLAQYREQHPESSSPQDKKAKQAQIPSEYTTFPRSTDQFDATINGSNVQVIHKGSDARWEVNLAGEK